MYQLRILGKFLHVFLHGIYFYVCIVAIIVLELC